MAPADDRGSIGVMGEQGRLHRFVFSCEEFGSASQCMRRSSITTSRSGATISSVKTRPVMRSASNSITSGRYSLAMRWK